MIVCWQLQYKSLNSKDSPKRDCLWHLAFVEGVEPPTCGLGNRCSILLSYTNTMKVILSSLTPYVLQVGCKVGCKVCFSFLFPSRIGLKVAILGGFRAYLTLIFIPAQALGATISSGCNFCRILYLAFCAYFASYAYINLHIFHNFWHIQ